MPKKKKKLCVGYILSSPGEAEAEAEEAEAEAEAREGQREGEGQMGRRAER